MRFFVRCATLLVELSAKSTRPLRVAIVAGEESGDILGSGLIEQIQKLYPSATFEGVAGERMQAKGAKSLFPMERLSIMGLVEVLKRLRELLGRRKGLVKRWLSNKPDIFIGIDAPDFNLGLARKLKAAGIPTVHYVSPSVWAWREKRLKKIEQSVDLMLCFLPFEAAYYDNSRVDAQFIGHPLASRLPLDITKEAAKEALGLDPSRPVVGLMPGSRGSEVANLTPDFIETAIWLAERRADVQFVIPAANEARYQQISELLASHASRISVHLVKRQSQTVLMASDSVLISSGTATLEAMLCGTPMVVSYRMSAMTYAIISRMLKTQFVSLPNLLANELLVPELLQNSVRAEVLGPHLLRSLEDEAYRDHLHYRFSDLSALIRMDSDVSAALAVDRLIEASS